MGKLQQKLTATATVTTALKLTTRQIEKLLVCISDDAVLADEIKEREEKRVKNKDKIEAIFAEAGEEAQLLDGCDINGVPLKIVSGDSSAFDKVAFLKHYGLSDADYKKFVKKTPKKPYLLIGKKGGK